MFDEVMSIPGMSITWECGAVSGTSRLRYCNHSRMKPISSRCDSVIFFASSCTLSLALRVDAIAAIMSAWA